MAHSLKDLDAFITGQNDSNAPFNQPDEEIDNRTVSELVENCEYESPLKLLSEIRKEVNALRQYARIKENYYLLRRLNSIYNKL